MVAKGPSLWIFKGYKTFPRPGIEPWSSWILVRFATTEPQGERQRPVDDEHTPIIIFFFLLCPQHVEVSQSGIKPRSQL